MPKIAVVTDTACALPSETVQEFTASGRFAQVPLPVSVGGATVAEADTSERITLAHIQGEPVTTSAPGLGALLRIYEDFEAQGFDAIFSVHLSGELSSTVQVAHTAARNMKIPVYVIDTRTVAMAQGLVVEQLMRASALGLEAPVLAEYAMDVADNTRLFFYVPTLEALRRGGRIHPALATVGQMFQIRPVATVDDGKLVYLERPRTIARAKASLVHYIQRESQRPRDFWMPEEGLLAPKGKVVAVHYSGNTAEAHRFVEELNAPQATVTPLPDVLAAHTGVGVLAAVTY
ncbi:MULTISPECIES: DegV family protein [unclassified Rothia (in: high G+C Gram-positive bacteria)]|uniref:DegV family protein n=1 Tax=unclassified Rothia (in: high G+C Gram-positive bacteria) TaxID=2689056 RepID=UPI001956B264|nr:MULTISPECIES: DegV family protein [unclassified Rothia (in: high G+C Gram-positive bacteria)]MBM7050514.1 DegV family protein [Rothia sp. ZJ1223]QRZ60709.1 DegV family protein [Rothia sp. ZJ932]